MIFSCIYLFTCLLSLSSSGWTLISLRAETLSFCVSFYSQHLNLSEWQHRASENCLNLRDRGEIFHVPRKEKYSRQETLIWEKSKKHEERAIYSPQVESVWPKVVKVRLKWCCHIGGSLYFTCYNMGNLWLNLVKHVIWEKEKFGALCIRRKKD